MRTGDIGSRGAAGAVSFNYLSELLNWSFSTEPFSSAMKKELGPAMTLLRLRRSRLDTASSCALKRKKDGP